MTFSRYVFAGNHWICFVFLGILVFLRKRQVSKTTIRLSVFLNFKGFERRLGQSPLWVGSRMKKYGLRLPRAAALARAHHDEERPGLLWPRLRSRAKSCRRNWCYCCLFVFLSSARPGLLCPRLWPRR